LSLEENGRHDERNTCPSAVLDRRIIGFPGIDRNCPKY
jgi:hypothetical protein